MSAGCRCGKTAGPQDGDGDFAGKRVGGRREYSSKGRAARLGESGAPFERAREACGHAGVARCA